MAGNRQGRQLSLATRRELVQAVAERHPTANRADKQKISTSLRRSLAFTCKTLDLTLRTRS
jgi:hypothetical protein